MNKITNVAVAVFQKPNGTFLLASRPEGKPYAGYWEFPGGKIEAHETVRDALKRELIEELNVVIDHATPWLTFMMHYTHATVRLHTWRVTAWHEADARGMCGLEGQMFEWQAINAITVAPTLPGCVPIFRALSLPTTYVITSASIVGVDAYLQYLRGFSGKKTSNRSPGNGLQDAVVANNLSPFVLSLSKDMAIHNRQQFDPTALRQAQGERSLLGNTTFPALLQIREKNLSPSALEKFAKEAIAITREHGIRVLINSDITLAERLDAAGVHLTASQLHTLNTRPDFAWVGASAHNRQDIERAASLNCDFAVLGSVKETPSHPGQTPMGWNAFADAVFDTPIPVYAIGGMTTTDIDEAIIHGAHGIAMQRGAFKLA